jgi:hypothetical protein
MTEQRGSSTLPNSQLAPDELNAENALICEKLLGWAQSSVKGYWYPNQAQAGSVSTPTFTSWHHAGLILDALAKAGQRPDLGHYRDGEWHCMVNATDDLVPATFGTGPLAIRDAALAYIEARAEHEAAEGERATAARDGDWREYYP